VLGEPGEHGLDLGDGAEGVEALGARAELGGGQLERLVEQVAVLRRALTGAVHVAGEALSAQPDERPPDHVDVVGDDGVAVRRLVAGGDDRRLAQRIGLGGREGLLHEAAQDPDLGVRQHGRSVARRAGGVSGSGRARCGCCRPRR
jgi:hypothetical protein